MAKWLTKMIGLAFGYGVKTNLAEAYLYLMQTYEPGDKSSSSGFRVEHIRQGCGRR